MATGTNPTLDLSALVSALQSLHDGLVIDEAPDHPARDERLNQLLRAGVIQNFEFCFEHGRKLKKFSDLDLLLEATEPLPVLQLANLREAFSASDLPFRVDIVERQSLSPSFAAAIERDGLVPIATAQPAIDTTTTP